MKTKEEIVAEIRRCAANAEECKKNHQYEAWREFSRRVETLGWVLGKRWSVGKLVDDTEL